MLVIELLEEEHIKLLPKGSFNVIDQFTENDVKYRAQLMIVRAKTKELAEEYKKLNSVKKLEQ